MSSRRTAHLLSRKRVDGACVTAYHACTGSLRSNCIEDASVRGRVGLPGTGGRPGGVAHKGPEDARPQTPCSCSVHASNLHRNNARRSWQLTNCNVQIYPAQCAWMSIEVASFQPS
jgi:hypothetical protein